MEWEAPYSDTYDWPNMIDDCIWNQTLSLWEDHNHNPLTVTQAQIDAVAELSHEIGVAVGMDYGCKDSHLPIPVV